jgi:hypothetical protein
MAEPNTDADSLREKIQSWLMGEGWTLSEKNHGTANWLIEARDSGGRHLVIGQRQGKEDQILLEGAVAVAEPHQQQLAALSGVERQEMLWNLRFALLTLGVEFHGVEEPMTRVMIGQRIYLDGLTKDRFLQRVSRVRNGVLLVIWSVARQLKLAPPPGAIPEAQGVN